MEDLAYKNGYQRLLEQVLVHHSALGRLQFWNDQKEGITAEKLQNIITELETKLQNLKENEKINQ
jgi:hypothetical protein